MASKTVWSGIREMLAAKNIYNIVVIGTLGFLLFNYSLLEIPRETIFGYGMLYILTLIALKQSGQADIIFSGAGLIKWEKDKTALAVVANWSIGLICSLLLLFLVQGLVGRDVAAIPSEYVLQQIAVQCLLIGPIETVVFQVCIPQFLGNYLGTSKWALIANYLIAEAIFAGMHFNAYGGSFPGMFMALGAGILFQFIAIRIAPEMSAGIHSAMNIRNLGLIGV